MNTPYEQQGDYLIPCIKTKQQKEIHLSVYANRHNQYLKQSHAVQYYNFLTSERLYDYLDGIKCQAENLFEQTVKSLAKQEQVTEKLKAKNMIIVCAENEQYHNRATKIINVEVIFN